MYTIIAYMCVCIYMNIQRERQRGGREFFVGHTLIAIIFVHRLVVFFTIWMMSFNEL